MTEEKELSSIKGSSIEGYGIRPNSVDDWISVRETDQGWLTYTGENARSTFKKVNIVKLLKI